MKHTFTNWHFTFNIFGKLVIALLLLSATVTAQKLTSQEEFYIGAKIGNKPDNVEDTFNSYLECGFNSIWWDTYQDTEPYLKEFKGIILAENGRSRKDYIHHYATSYYSKWEAEQNQKPNRVGIKHKHGKEAKWKGVRCWSSDGLKSPKDSLIYGPQYRQEKRYKRWLYKESGWSRFDVDHNVRFKMALNYDPRIVSADEDVCEIKVVYRCGREYPGGWDPPEDFVLLKKTLKVKDFAKGGEFDYIHFNETYEYSEKFMIPEFDNPAKTNYTYNDTETGLGIQFRIDWLRKDDLCTLYVDNIEVYDNDGWNDMIKDPKGTAEKIKNYAKNYSDWSNIKYWFAHDEPYSIDAFLPYHIVDSIATSTIGVPLITEFNPYWTHDGTINGEDFLQQWCDIAKPQKLFIDFYPFSPEYPFRADDIEALRIRFQKCHTLQPGFWYSPQAAGVMINNEWKIWRIPENYEFNASVMLGLAHGAKGLMLFSYISFNEIKGLVANNQPNFEKRKLWYFLKDNLIPRIRGKLGTKLMELDYTGGYLQDYKIGKMQSNPALLSTKNGFLTLDFDQAKSVEKYWHCGMFIRPKHPDDKYFFLANLYTQSESRSINIKIIEEKNNYKNYRFRNIEGKNDTTFTDELTIKITHPKGEGYLYQVAPVIKYGGKLLYSEETKDGMELTDDMIIDNGALLTINGNYNSNANIIVKNGRITYKNNGRINFATNKTLITK